MLHNSEPVKPLAVNTEFPQLSETVTIGIAGIVFGAEVPVPAELMHPLRVCVAVYVAAFVTVIEGVVAPVLHNIEPVKPLAVKTELPQLSVTVTDGAAGIVFGAEVPLPAALVHPLTDCVTV